MLTEKETEDIRLSLIKTHERITELVESVHVVHLAISNLIRSIDAIELDVMKISKEPLDKG